MTAHSRLAAAPGAASDRAIRDALLESRQRYKELVEISSDFAWETGEDGRFVFVSRDAIGWPAAAMIGRYPAEFLAEPGDPAGGIFAAVPYCVDLIGGPYMETDAAVSKTFRPKSAIRPAPAA